MERGDVLELRASRSSRGHEPRGHRYAVVVQADELWPWSTLIVVPTSASAAPTVFRPTIEIRETPTTALVDQIGAFDLGRFGNRIGRVRPSELSAIDVALGSVLALR